MVDCFIATSNAVFEFGITSVTGTNHVPGTGHGAGAPIGCGSPGSPKGDPLLRPGTIRRLPRLVYPAFVANIASLATVRCYRTNLEVLQIGLCIRSQNTTMRRPTCPDRHGLGIPSYPMVEERDQFAEVS